MMALGEAVGGVVTCCRSSCLVVGVQDGSKMDNREVHMTVVPKSELYNTVVRSTADRSYVSGRQQPAMDTVLRLRGLPYQAREPDVRAFFEGIFRAAPSSGVPLLSGCASRGELLFV